MKKSEVEDAIAIFTDSKFTCFYGTTTLRITTLSIMTLSIKGSFVTLSIYDTQHNKTVLMLSVAFYSVFY